MVLGADPVGAQEADAWTPLFNGRDLDGWIPKIRGSEAGEDPLETFVVDDGLLRVDYSRYDEFGDRFGHLFFETALTEYRLRVEYRFVGEQLTGGPSWAFKNSGVMLHAQSPTSMLAEQDFPISLEAQLLGGDGTGERPTANLCTPGTHVDVDGAQIRAHCIPASAPTFHGEEWVTVELVVTADTIVHLVDGDTVLVYTRPVVGGGAVDGHDPALMRDGERLSSGHVALQSESHPIEFRSVLLRRIDPDPVPSLGNGPATPHLAPVESLGSGGTE